MNTTDTVRTVIIECSDWSITAAGFASTELAAVFHANRVVVCSEAARAEGIDLGLRRREAQGRCPDLEVIAADPDRDGREFETVAATVELLAPGVAIVVPGILALRARGPTRYFGSEQVVADTLRDEVIARLSTLGAPPAHVGIADGLFTALVAAGTDEIVEPGASAAFLADRDIRSLLLPGAGGGHRRDFVDLLRRLGIQTLGQFARLPTDRIASRFDADALIAHRLAQGLDPYPVTGRKIPAELEVEIELDPPVELVSSAAFAARTLAEELQLRLDRYGLACTRLIVTARTENGEEHQRLWRHDGILTTTGIADRARWQLDGWLTGKSGTPPTAGVRLLRLAAAEVVPAHGAQLPLWGGRTDADAAVHRALVRLQGMLGPDAVLRPVLGGGRGPADQVRWVPLEDERTPRHAPDPPWPGRLPAPHPATVLSPPEALDVRDESGTPVRVRPDLTLTASPAILRRRGHQGRVTGWAGPWPVDERWWDRDGAYQASRIQVLAQFGTDIRSWLLTTTDDGWALEAAYD